MRTVSARFARHYHAERFTDLTYIALFLLLLVKIKRVCKKISQKRVCKQISKYEIVFMVEKGTSIPIIVNCAALRVF